MPDPLKPPPSVTLVALRTPLFFDRSTEPWGTRRGETRRVEVRCTLELTSNFRRNDRRSFGIEEGGVTGFERVYIDDRDFVMKSIENGWHACAGTPDRWDELFIPAEEMRRAFELLGIIPINLPPRPETTE